MAETPGLLGQEQGSVGLGFVRLDDSSVVREPPKASVVLEIFCLLPGIGF